MEVVFGDLLPLKLHFLLSSCNKFYCSWLSEPMIWKQTLFIKKETIHGHPSVCLWVIGLGCCKSWLWEFVEAGFPPNPYCVVLSCFATEEKILSQFVELNECPNHICPLKNQEQFVQVLESQPYCNFMLLPFKKNKLKIVSVEKVL